MQELASIQRHNPTGLWWPSNVDPLAGYQYMIRRVTDIDLAVKLCRKTAVCVQAGGNIGMWPLRLAKHFETIHTFEPVPIIYSAMIHNVRHVPGIIPYRSLLTDVPRKKLPFHVHPGGTSRVCPESEKTDDYDHTTTIDELKLSCCDAIFLDVEGHELEALSGARDTISNFRPVITVEVWEDKKDAYLKWFDDNQYDLAKKSHGDYIFVPR